MAIAAALVMIPILVFARIAARINRGQFDWRTDALFAAGVTLIAVIAAAVFAYPIAGLRLILPLPIVVGGAYALFNSERVTESEERRMLVRVFGAIALISGLWWILLVITRLVSG
jgi:hypothetical protein